MNPLVITGWGVTSAAGVGRESLSTALASPETQNGGNLDDLYPEAMPSTTSHGLADFDVRKILGRKGTSFLDRATSLALVTCGEAIEDSGLVIDDESREGIGVVLGTTSGSLKSMSDFSRETLIEDRPYLVNPVLFPNTVMNCAAGQAAIRFGLKGVNTTIAGGQLAFLSVLRYAARTLRGGNADALLAGVVEELTPHTAWAAHLADPEGSPGIGEGAAVFVVEPPERPGLRRSHPRAEVLSVVTGFSPGGEAGGGIARALEGCIRDALARGGAKASDLHLVLPCRDGKSDDGGPEAEALTAVLGGQVVESLSVERLLGRCQAAATGLQVAALLALHHDDPSRDGRLSLLTGWTREGGIGAAVLRGWSHVGPDRG